MSAIPRRLGVLFACLSALATLTACGSGLPEAKIGTLEIDHYVALGDGYAAAPYTGTTVPAKGCYRSAADYPALLAEKIKAKALVDVTCLYATTASITRAGVPARGNKGPVPAQLDSVTPDTDLVTLTVGFSDREFFSRLFDICTDDCEDGGVEPEDLVNDLAQIGAAVHETVADVMKKAPETRLYVVGYPQLLPRTGSCAAMPELTQNEVDAVNAAISQLNDHLRAAARAVSGYFIDVAGLSKGHDVCSDDPWVIGKADVEGGAPRFHPRAALNVAIADALATKLTP